MIIITDEQKKFIESQGYMVVEFKLWVKRFSKRFNKWLGQISDTYRAIIAFLQDVTFRVFDILKDLAECFLEAKQYINHQEKRKYPFVRSLGRKYEFNYSRVTIYHCRNNC